MSSAKEAFGLGEELYIIAELGVNHDGSVERAIELTKSARECGASAIKLQVFDPDLLMSAAARLTSYQEAAGENDPIEMLRRLTLPINDMARVVEAAHASGLHAIATVFSVQLIGEAEQLDWDAYKTASPDIIHRPLLEALAGTRRPLIVSTGAAGLDEIQRAVSWLHDARGRLVLMQCVSSYPTPSAMAELGGIAAIKAATGLPVGYSDHTESTETGVMAVRAGAVMLEKHLTYDRTAAGPDHGASLDPAGFHAYAGDAIAAWEQIRRVGSGQAPQPWPLVKRVLPIEQNVRTLSRQSLTTRQSLARGHTLSRADLTVKRPGTGIEPFRLDEVLGRRLARDVEADMPLVAGDLA